MIEALMTSWASATAGPGLLAQAEGAATFWMPEAGGGFVDQVDPLFYFIYYVNVFFFLLIGAVMFWSAWAHRQKKSERGVVAEGATHNTLLEIGWTVPPLIIVLVIFLWGFRGYLDMYTVPPGGNAYTIDVEARQWGWNFYYPGGGQTGGASWDGSAAPVKIPAGQPVLFRLSAVDVIHSFYIPAMRIKKDCVPGRYNQMWVEVPLDRVTPGEPLRFPYHCTEYCGDQHSQMNGMIEVYHPDTFFRGVGTPDGKPIVEAVNTWNPDGLAPVALGERLYAQAGCLSCHSLDGPGRAQGWTGPTWQNLYNRPNHAMSDGTQLTADDAYIYEAIYFPTRKIVAGYPNQMASYQGMLRLGDVRAIIEYMKTISTHATTEPLAAWPEGYDGESWLTGAGEAAEVPLP